MTDEKKPKEGTEKTLYGYIAMVSIMALIIGIVVGYVALGKVGQTDLQKKVDELDKKVIDLEKSNENLNSQLNAKTEQINALNQNITKLNQNISALNSALGEKNATITELQKNITVIQHELNETEFEAEQRDPMQIHLRSEFLKFECTTCHITDKDGNLITTENTEWYDLTELEDGDFRTIANAQQLCVKCHGTFPDSTTKSLRDKTGPMQPSYKTQNCISCHTEWKTKMTNPIVDNRYIEQEITNASDEKIAATCLKCHGGQAFYETYDNGGD